MKPPKKDEKRRKQLHFSEIGYLVLHKECNNGKNNNDQKIYASMAYMSDSDKNSSRDFGDSSQLTNCILDSGETCHTKPQV